MTHSFYMEGGRPPHSFVGFCGALKLLQKGARSRVRNPPFGDFGRTKPKPPPVADISPLQSPPYLPEPKFPRKSAPGLWLCRRLSAAARARTLQVSGRVPRQTNPCRRPLHLFLNSQVFYSHCTLHRSAAFLQPPRSFCNGHTVSATAAFFCGDRFPADPQPPFPPLPRRNPPKNKEPNLPQNKKRKPAPRAKNLKNKCQLQKLNTKHKKQNRSQGGREPFSFRSSKTAVFKNFETRFLKADSL